MRNINDFIKSKPRGFRIPWAEKNYITRWTLDNWQAKGNYYIHDGYIYKRVKRLSDER